MKKLIAITTMFGAVMALTGCSAFKGYEVEDIGNRGGFCSNARLLGVVDPDAYLAALTEQGYINSIDAKMFKAGGRRIQVGMTECGVRMVWGAPHDIDRYGGEYGSSQRWTYKDPGYYTNSYHFIRFGKNNTVTSWSFD